ncbi:MAG: CvpA family protein [Candidatus Omnitrophota bacterium]
MQDALIHKLNWVDVAIIVVFVRIVFVGFRRGFTVEIFKLIATVCGIFISIHFYSSISKFVSLHSPLTAEFAGPIVLAGLFVIVLIIFKFIRDGLMFVFHIQPIPVIDKWGGLLLSLLRGYFVASIVILFIFLVPIDYFENSTKSSFSKEYLLELSPRTYAFVFENIYSKFSSSDKLNKEVFESIQ